MRALTWILCCLSLILVSECSQIVLSNDAENANPPKCRFESINRARIETSDAGLQMSSESRLHNYKLGHGNYHIKYLTIDIISHCYDNYCKALWKETPDSGGYYLYMGKNGYIYETSSETSSDRYFVYSFNAKAGRCVWRNRVKGSYLTRSANTEDFYVIGSSDGPVLDFKFLQY